MMRIGQVYFLMVLIFAGGCGLPQVRGSISDKAHRTSPKIAVASDNMLADAISGELLMHGVSIIERNQLSSILNEYTLAMSGLTEDVKLIEAVKILNIDALLFVKMHPSPEVPGRVESAVVKIVDVQTAELLGVINYQNGRAGMPGSWADADAKESLPKSAIRIANKLLEGFGIKSKVGWALPTINGGPQ